MSNRLTSSAWLKTSRQRRIWLIAGALLVMVFTEAVSLGLLEPPKDADIVAGELQSVISPSYGGPYAA
ncbi:MAG: hypothetical protein WKF37_15465 [Bryobacteraceae bacterium]